MEPEQPASLTTTREDAAIFLCDAHANALIGQVKHSVDALRVACGRFDAANYDALSDRIVRCDAQQCLQCRQEDGAGKRATDDAAALDADQARHWDEYGWRDFEVSRTAWRITHVKRDAEVAVIYTHLATARPMMVYRATPVCYLLYFQAPDEQVMLERVSGAAAVASLTQSIADVDAIYSDVLGALRCDPEPVLARFLDDAELCDIDAVPREARRELTAPRRLVESMVPDDAEG